MVSRLRVDLKISYPFHSWVHRQLNRVSGFVWVFATGLVLAGCATKYQEPPRSETQKAILQAVAPLWVVSIDGRRVSQVTFTGDKQFSISPGNHVFEIKYANYSGSERGEYQTSDGRRHTIRVYKASRENFFVPFTAQSGRHYYAHGGLELTLWKPYINETPPNGFLDLPVH